LFGVIFIIVEILDCFVVSLLAMTKSAKNFLEILRFAQNDRKGLLSLRWNIIPLCFVFSD